MGTCLFCFSELNYYSYVYKYLNIKLQRNTKCQWKHYPYNKFDKNEDAFIIIIIFFFFLISLNTKNNASNMTKSYKNYSIILIKRIVKSTTNLPYLLRHLTQKVF